MPTCKTLCTLESLSLPFSFCHGKLHEASQNNTSPQLAVNYRGCLQTAGTGVERGRTFVLKESIWADLYFPNLRSINSVGTKTCIANPRTQSVCVGLGKAPRGESTEWRAEPQKKAAGGVGDKIEQKEMIVHRAKNVAFTRPMLKAKGDKRNLWVGFII